MSEKWLVLQFLTANRDPSYVGPPYSVLTTMDLERPDPGSMIMLPTGGHAKVLWVDPDHHHIGIERIEGWLRAKRYL
jgi:hypothetical protein